MQLSWFFWHQGFGISVGVLVLVRIVYGFAGSYHARFKNFFPTATRVRQYMRNSESMTGHKPPAALAVLVLIMLLGMQAISGLFSIEEDSELVAPLSHLISETLQIKLTGWHLYEANWLMAMIALHVSVVLFKQFVLKESIINSMLFVQKKSEGE